MEEEVIELSKPKRSRGVKKVKEETKVESVSSPPPVEVVQKPAPQPEEVPVKPKRTYKKKKVEEDIPKENSPVEPVIVPVVTPVEKPVEKPVEPVVKTRSVEDIDPETFRLVFGFLEEQGVIKKPEEEVKRSRGRPKKVVEEAPVETPMEVVKVSKPKKVQKVKEVEPVDSQRLEIEERIDFVKRQIADKKQKKTARENEYLKEKLAELEQELLELDDEPVIKPKSVRGAVKITEEQLEKATKPKALPRHALMSSFGF